MAVLMLIIRYLNKNRARTLFLGISIMISAALITSLNFTINDLKTEKRLERINGVGLDYDGAIITKSQKYLDNLNKMSIIEEKSSTIILSKPIKLKKKHAVQLIGFEENCRNIFNFKLKEGRYPIKSNEIALESWILDSLDRVPKIGDKISFNYLIFDSEKSKSEEGKSSIYNEFIVVGIFDHIAEYETEKNYSIGYVTKDYAKDKIVNKGRYEAKNIVYNTYIKLKSGFDVDFGKQLLLDNNAIVKMDALRYEQLEAEKKFDVIERILSTIVTIVSCIVIYNMFVASTIIRTSEIGMLKALGFSPKQVRRLIIGEGLVIGIVFIFIGILMGTLFYEVSLSFISGEALKYRVSQISLKVVIEAYTFGMLAIILGSLVSAIKISKISSVEAISANLYVKIKEDNFKTSNDMGGTTKKFLWSMAKCNIKRNRVRFIITTICMVASILLFMLVNYIMNSQNPKFTVKKAFGADIIIINSGENSEDVSNKKMNEIKSIQGIEEVIPVVKDLAFLNMTYSKNRLTKEGLDSIYEESQKRTNLQQNIKKGYFYINAIQNVYSNKQIEELKSNISEGNIDLKLMEKEPICILVQNLRYNNHTSFKVGDKIKINKAPTNVDEKERTDYQKDVTLTIGAILKNEDYIQTDGSIYTEFIVSDEAYKKFFNNGVKAYNRNIKINISKDSEYDNIIKKLEETVRGDQDLKVKGYKEELVEKMANRIKIAMIFYNFSIITAISSIANIFGVMIMNIVLRKKEFAMLRAVGMSKKEVKRLIINESFIYGGIGGLIGLILGVPATYLLFILGRKTLMSGMIWKMPILTVSAIILVLIITCLMAAAVSARKVFEDSVVDSIRNIE